MSGFTAAGFQSFLAARQEPAWLVALRREAWAAFHELPAPDRRQEAWLQTDIRDFRLEQFAPPGEEKGSSEVGGGQWAVDRDLPSARNQSPAYPSSLLPYPLLPEGVDLAGIAAALDGRACLELAAPELARQGVLFGSLDRLIADHEALLRPYLFQAVDYRADRFAALHAAFWSGGTVLYVPRGVTIDRPLHVFSALSPGQTDLGHVLVVLDEGAEATLLTETASFDDDAGLHCGALELHVGRRARLRCVALQNWGAGVWHFAQQRAIAAEGADLRWNVAAVGGRTVHVRQHVALAGPGANAQIGGVMFAKGTQCLAYHTLQHHQAPHCTSDLLYKGALKDQSRLVWRGMIKVDRGAQKTDGYQRNDNLMLSDDARADSIPGLEIEADDVKCSHGATAGRVDDEQVFYARCRGLTRDEAVRTIVAGFFQQVCDRIPLAGLARAVNGRD